MLKLLTVIALLWPAVAGGGQSENSPQIHPAQPQQRQMIRVGWGDMLFESLAFPEARRKNGGKGCTGHLFAEYQYQLTDVVSVGAQLDFEGIYVPDMRNYDITVMPTVRFTYFRRPVVKLYSGLGVGMLFACDNHGGLELSPALNLNPIGVEVSPWKLYPISLGAELGMLNALVSGTRIYLLGARMLSFSVNYRF
jgi:hypothetical protein